MKPLMYHESRPRGSEDFPLEYHYLEASHPRYQMPYHWHEEYEMLHVLTGEFDLTLDDETCTLHAGDLAFIAAERLHGGVPRDCTYECIVFDLRLVMGCGGHCRDLLMEIAQQRVAPRAVYRAGDAACLALPPVFRALGESQPGYELITLGGLLQFLGEAYRAGAGQPVASVAAEGRRIHQIKRVFELIESDYASPLTLSALADAAHMSPRYFCRFFREITHRTPVDYLNYFRIESACGQMAATEKSLTEIALDTGFSNLNYFIRQFRKYKGMTPGQYQQKMRGA